MTTSDGYELTATKRPAPTCTAMDEDGEHDLPILPSE